MNSKKFIEKTVYPQLYRTSKGWRIFFFIFMPPLICLMTWLMIYSFVGNDIKGLSVRIVFFLMGLGFDIFLIYAIVSIAKYRVEVFSDKIVEIGVFKKKEIMLKNIDGFRILPMQYINQVQFIYKDTKKKKNITLMMNDSNVFLQWLNSSIRNLDAEDYEKEVKTILSNEELGMTEEQRAYSFERAKKFASFLNILSIATMLWVLFRPQPYEIAIWTMILFPILAISSSKLFPGLIKFDESKKGAYPSVAAAFLMPGIALSLRALLDWDILSWQNFWVPFAIISICLLFLLLWFFKELRNKYGYAILLLCFCAVYGYGATISLNGINDKSTTISYSAEIINKRISTGKNTSYYLKLSPWGPRTSSKDVSVSKGFYNSVQIKDSTKVHVKKGTLNIPWFFLEKQ